MGRGRLVAISVSVAIVVALAVILRGWSPMPLLGLVLNSVRSATNPAGTLKVEVRTASIADRSGPPGAPVSSGVNSQSPDVGSWPSYNRTLSGERFSQLSEINTQTVRGLKILCTYDTMLRESFETGPIMVNGALIGTTALDTFSIDPSTCHENWRVHEEYKPVGLSVNRGAAYLEGRLFRGMLDGRVLAYDFKSGKRLWATAIADLNKGELVDAAPIAWDGLVFVGIALGDLKGIKGRMYALAAESGRIVWETYLVPKGDGDPTRGPAGAMPVSALTTWKNAPDVPITGGGTWTSYTLDGATGYLYVPVGNPAPDFVPDLREGENLFTNSVLELKADSGAYVNHFQIAPRDWHDWDVSNTPAIVHTRGGKQLLTFAPKNGYLYGVDLVTHTLLYRSAVTRVENNDIPLVTNRDIHFCPGAVGGAEWNGVAYDPQHNLIFTGETEWCTTVRLQDNAQVKAAPSAQGWMGHVKTGPLDLFGTQDPHSDWAGWLYATDADSGAWSWRLKSNYPILGGVTATAGGLVFFGDMGGNFYAVDARDGRRLWGKKLEGAIGGGVITYSANGSQKIAVATGLTSVLWPTEQATGKIVIFGIN
jgi:alcohol dehydrogenase (cytochrome c)